MKARDLLHIYAAIGDLKLVDYDNTLAVAALIRLLQEKGVFTEDEFRAISEKLDTTALPIVSSPEPQQEPHQAHP